jgi:hypothetical protein
VYVDRAPISPQMLFKYITAARSCGKSEDHQAKVDGEGMQ